MKHKLLSFATGVFLLSAAGYAATPLVISKIDLTKFQVRTGKISSVNSSQLLVKTADGQTLQGANAPGSQASYINAGQTVWFTPTKLYFVSFPIETSRSDDVSVGHMKSDVKLSNTGILRVTTKTWTNNNLQGFTGGVIVVLMKKDGNDLYVSAEHKYGVNGTNVPGAPSSRTETWTENVPLDKVNEAAKIAIVQMNAPTNRIDDFIAHAKEVAEIAKTVSEAYSNFSGGPGGQPGGTGGTTGTMPPSGTP